MSKDKKPLELSPQDQQEMNEALDGLKSGMDPAKIMEMFSGFQEGMELAKQSLTVNQTMDTRLVGIHNILIEIRELLKNKP